MTESGRIDSEILVGEADELNIETDRVCRFYEAHWKRKIALAVPSFYRWQFTQSPADEGKDHCMLAVQRGSNEIIGIMGLNRRPFFLHGTMVSGAELTTWIVRDTHTGMGIGSRILSEIQSKYDVLIGMGISDMALPVYMKKGFRRIRAIPRYVRVFDLERVEPYAQCDALARRLVQQWSREGLGTRYRLGSIDRESIRDLESVLPMHLNFYRRDYDFLDWRYSSHPVFRYGQSLVFSDRAEHGKGALVCVRKEDCVENLNILHVLDCVGDPVDMQAAVSFIHEFCSKNDIHVADFFCTSSKVSRFFTSSGWFSINDDTCFQFPHLFHPIELRTPPTTSLVYWSREAFAEMASVDKLYVTKQDADLDRPTIAAYRNGLDDTKARQ